MDLSSDTVGIRLFVILILLALSAFFFFLGDSIDHGQQNPHPQSGGGGR